MFRDPTFYVAFREHVVPLLRTYPFIRIWNAGCSTGEETYSLAILLEEEGLYERARIYATDFNARRARAARAPASSPLDRMQEYTQNYQRAGGTRDFSAYYSVERGAAQARRAPAASTSSSPSTTSPRTARSTSSTWCSAATS